MVAKEEEKRLAVERENSALRKQLGQMQREVEQKQMSLQRRSHELRRALWWLLFEEVLSADHASSGVVHKCLGGSFVFILKSDALKW